MRLKAKKTIKLPYTVEYFGPVNLFDYFYGFGHDRANDWIKANITPDRIASTRSMYKRALKSSYEQNKHRDEDIRRYKERLPEFETERRLSLNGGYRFQYFTIHKRKKYDLVYLGKDSLSKEGNYKFSVMADGIRLDFSMPLSSIQSIFQIKPQRKKIQRRKEWIIKKKLLRQFPYTYKVYSDYGYGDGGTYGEGLNIVEAIKCYHNMRRNDGPFILSDYVDKYKSRYSICAFDGDTYGITEDSTTLTWEREDFDPGDI